MQSWKTHFSRLLNPNLNLQPPNELPFMNNHNAPGDELNTDITAQEILVVVQHAKRNKAVGMDGIPVEVLTNLTVRQSMCSFFNMCFKTG